MVQFGRRKIIEVNTFTFESPILGFRWHLSVINMILHARIHGSRWHRCSKTNLPVEKKSTGTG